MTILVADDDGVHLHLVNTRLRAKGYDVVIARDAMQVLMVAMRAKPAAILLDIDGTLAPIVEQPSHAVVPERTRQLLIALARRYAAVACVSGRRASEARAMVAIGTIPYLGSHGAEVLRAGWTESKLDPELADWRRRSDGPPYCRITKTVVRYLRTPVIDWLRSRLVQGGAPVSGGGDSSN